MSYEFIVERHTGKFWSPFLYCKTKASAFAVLADIHNHPFHQSRFKEYRVVRQVKEELAWRSLNDLDRDAQMTTYPDRRT